MPLIAEDLRCARGQGGEGNPDPVVAHVQEILEDAFGAHLAGAEGGVDGIFGPSTEQAVAAFQHANSMNASGIVDSATSSALQDPNSLAIGETPDPSAPSKVPTWAKVLAGVGGTGAVGFGVWKLGSHMKWW